MGAPTKSSQEPDLASLDESWDAEPESEDDPDDEVDSLEAGWGDPKRGRTAAEKARAREEKTRLRIQRRKARAAAVAQKQKSKQKKRPPTPSSSSRPSAPARRAGHAASETPEPAEATAPKRPTQPLKRAPARDWIRMGVAVAVIVTLGVIALFVFGRT